MRYWDDGHMDAGWGLAMMLGVLGVWVLLSVAIGLAIVWAARSARSRTAPDGQVTETAEHILAERLASGDIDPEEYRARLVALTTPNVP